MTSNYYRGMDVISEKRAKGHPASDEELAQTLRAAQLLCKEDGLALCSTICCSGNGHYVVVPIIQIPIDNNEVAIQFKNTCLQIMKNGAVEVHGTRFDNVFNLSRVMRVIGTNNCKGQPIPGRPHRRAYFVTEPIFARSMALHHMILYTEIEQNLHSGGEKILPQSIRCDLSKIEKCCFIKYCRTYPEKVTEPQWWGLITNMARLEGGPALIHEISCLDEVRYDYENTERVIKRVLASGYRPVSCQTLMSSTVIRRGRGSFKCPQIRQCPAKAPMYMTSLYPVYSD